MRLVLHDDNGREIFTKEVISDSEIYTDKGILHEEVTNFLIPIVDSIRMFIERHEEYGGTWQIPEYEKHESMLTSLVCLIKCKRICTMLDREGKVAKRQVGQLLKNTLDLMNYANFLYQILKKKVEMFENERE